MGRYKGLHPAYREAHGDGHLVMAGVDLATIKELLGHRDIQTTMRYAHLSQESLQGAANSASERIKAAMGK